jgi:hypothetical protein
MNLPGFTAEAALDHAKEPEEDRSYTVTQRHLFVHKAQVVPQQECECGACYGGWGICCYCA